MNEDLFFNYTVETYTSGPQSTVAPRLLPVHSDGTLKLRWVHGTLPDTQATRAARSARKNSCERGYYARRKEQVTRLKEKDEYKKTWELTTGKLGNKIEATTLRLTSLPSDRENPMAVFRIDFSEPELDRQEILVKLISVRDSELPSDHSIDLLSQMNSTLAESCLVLNLPTASTHGTVAGSVETGDLRPSDRAPRRRRPRLARDASSADKRERKKENNAYSAKLQRSRKRSLVERAIELESFYERWQAYTKNAEDMGLKKLSGHVAMCTARVLPDGTVWYRFLPPDTDDELLRTTATMSVEEEGGSKDDVTVQSDEEV